MKTRFFAFLAILAIVFVGSMNVHGLIPDDADGDGVPDSVDACPAENSSFFDRDGDGCIDEHIGARHTEYWGVADTLITYVINDQGSPNVLNGSDFTAIQDAMNAWPGVTGTELNVQYGGTVTQEDADGLDQVNLVTFVDDVYPFSPLVLAVGITTSFTSDTTVAGGRIVGTCALHVIWEDLAEVRSLAVDPDCRESGIGRELVEHCLAEAGSLRLRRVFALTYQPDFFSRLGFHPVEKSELPHKVWGHCTKCTKFPDCDEEAVMKILEPEP